MSWNSDPTKGLPCCSSTSLVSVRMTMSGCSSYKVRLSSVLVLVRPITFHVSTLRGQEQAVVKGAGQEPELCPVFAGLRGARSRPKAVAALAVPPCRLQRFVLRRCSCLRRWWRAAAFADSFWASN